MINRVALPGSYCLVLAPQVPSPSDATDDLRAELMFLESNAQFTSRRDEFDRVVDVFLGLIGACSRPPAKRTQARAKAIACLESSALHCAHAGEFKRMREVSWTLCGT